MRKISYTDVRILKDILGEIENRGVNIYEITNDEYLEFGVNWSAFGTQSVEQPISFMNDLQTAVNIATKINNLKLKVIYENVESFNNKEDYLKRKDKIKKEYIG